MQNARITFHPSKQRMQVRVDGILLADSTNTLELSANTATRQGTTSHVKTCGWTYSLFQKRPRIARLKGIRCIFR